MDILKGVSKVSNILDKTAMVLNEAAFGDIRNIFKNKMYDFKTRPIGILGKNYDFILEHLYRNIGNAEHMYDGYSTPIGGIANPNYNFHTKIPWFYEDTYKNRTANYIQYIKDTYGAALSVENINETDFFHIGDDASSVGYIDGAYAIDSLNNGTWLLPTPNGTGTDSRLGIVSGFYNGETLLNSIKVNDKRNSYNNSITKGINERLGLNTDNVADKKKAWNVKVEALTGRIVDGVFSPNEHIDSPVYISNWGDYNDFGAYSTYYNSLNKKSKKYYDENVFNNRNTSKKPYYPSSSGKNYIDDIGIIVGKESETRYIFKTLSTHSNISDAKNGGVYVYTEDENGSTDIQFVSYNAGTKFSRYTSYNEGLKVDDLLKKTNSAFKNGEYKTLIARFHTKNTDVEDTDITQTAISEEFGMSHGRNLLKVKGRWNDKSEGYNNPYCRVWTFHHQYHRLKDAIRPLEYGAKELYSNYKFSAFTADHSDYGFENGRVRLEKYGVTNKKNGLVNITPIDTKDVSRKVDIKNCMFSIENLAWKDMFSTDAKSRETFQSGGLSSEQKGPFGGRIMWFPPYDLKFSEDVSVNWSENSFIGRGEGIYTYVNTMRTGNLSFKILVDHPSVINYWENRGKSFSNSVDDVDDPEQMLLRFFAGCDMLSSKSVPKRKKKPVAHDDPTPAPNTMVLKFFVFYPNNYSGVDDDPDFAMKYLTNGLGAGMTKNANGETVDYQVPYAISPTIKYDNGTTYKGFGGYEIKPEKPISINTHPNAGETKMGTATVGETQVTLFAQEGESTDKVYERKWYYRVDKKYKNQKLLQKNYVDANSYCLNSSLGFQKVVDAFKIKDTTKLYSFTDVYVALEGNEAAKVLNGYFDVTKVYGDTTKKGLVTIFKEYTIDHVECKGMASQQGYEKKNLDLQRNRAMTVKRWLSKNKLCDANRIKITTGGTGGGDKGINNGDESAISNKLWRCAEVSIHLKESSSELVQNVLTERGLSGDVEGSYAQMNHLTGDTSNNDIIFFKDGSGNDNYNSSMRDRLKSIKMKHLNNNINELAFNIRHSVEDGNVNLNRAWDAIANFSEHDKFFDYDENGYIVDRGKSDFNFSFNNMHDEELKTINKTKTNNTDESSIVGKRRKSTTSDEVTRFDNESKFFYMLEKEEPFLHHKISDKIKYFDPAFHSISPEGFNARLTFLQQCTRQGPTIGNSDDYTANNTANNLAFGRPPVCILRIGDFYYTKILIDSLSINFDPMTWDLNTEGIGVMPMICNVDIRFKFIGGSSLAGHITRLQNALSFNYYANTEVYDNRSELAEYDENGNIIKFKPNTTA